MESRRTRRSKRRMWQNDDITAVGVVAVVAAVEKLTENRFHLDILSEW